MSTTQRARSSAASTGGFETTPNPCNYQLWWLCSRSHGLFGSGRSLLDFAPWQFSGRAAGVRLAPASAGRVRHSLRTRVKGQCAECLGGLPVWVCRIALFLDSGRPDGRSGMADELTSL
jgi:hypothetical protein